MNTYLEGDKKSLAEGYRSAAHLLAQLGRPNSRLPMLKRAMELHPEAEGLFELYHAAVEADDMYLAQVARDELMEINAKRRKPQSKLDLTRLGTTADFSIALSDEASTPPAAPVDYTPIKGRVLYVLHNSRPYANGGYATRGHGLALGLQQAGYDIVCLSRPGYPMDMDRSLRTKELPSEDNIDGIRYLRDTQPSRRGGHKTREYGPAAADVIERRIRELRPELVIAASAYLSSLPTLVASRRVGVPFIYEVRGFWEITRLSERPEAEKKPLVRMERYLESRIACAADEVLTLTSGMRDELVRRGVTRDKITLAPNSCDPWRFTPRGRDTAMAERLGVPAHVPVIGYIGTFVQYEGLDDLAMACGRLHRQGTDFRLLIVGSENTGENTKGPISRKIEEIAEQEGFSHKLIMPGRVPHSEVEGYYSLIDIAPFPRKPQPVTEMVSPMKPLEALAMQKAVLVSSVQALTDMVKDRETGLVYEKGNIDSFANAINTLIGDPALRKKLGETGRIWVENERSWKRTAERVGTIVERVISHSSAMKHHANPEAAHVSVNGEQI